jgi:hypothetical protein
MTRHLPLWLQQGSYAAELDRLLMNTLWGPTGGTVGLDYTAVPGTMTAELSPGRAVVPTATGGGSTLCVSDAVELITFGPAPGAGLERVDLVYVLPRGNDLDGGPDNDFVFSVLAGTPQAPPSTPGTEPVTPVGALPLYYLTIPGGSASLDSAVISRDFRVGGAGGLVGSIIPGPGIAVDKPDHDVVVTNTGVRSVVAGIGIVVTPTTGDITIGPAFPRTVWPPAGIDYTPDVTVTDVFNVGLRGNPAASPPADFAMRGPAGSGYDGQRLLIRMWTPAAFAIAWEPGYFASGLFTPPTVSLAGLTMTLGFIFDASAGVWVLLAADTIGY